ncbi:MAG: hypothetical protein JRI25_18225, partial [Deltaproteobacteria bacterium]|nr:hypothetical protein [Deltaproteobacteria bacterium]
ACSPSFLETGPCEDVFEGPAIATCPVPGWERREYDLVLPADYDGTTAIPVVLALHGGGGNKEGAARVTCASGEPDDTSCLHQHAQANGYAVVFPDGTSGRLIRRVRTWNAGGGVDEWRCTSGRACEEDVDDIAYFEALLDDLEERVAVDVDRVYATGLSNGAAMSHRLACELSERIAAVAPVGGAMQLTVAAPCAPSRPVAVLQVHGTEDPCWTYQGGPSECPIGQLDLSLVGVERTLTEWAELLGCDPGPVEGDLPDPEEDGTRTTRMRWNGCSAEFEHLKIGGGGHAWPDGYAYLKERTIGVVPRDWGNEVIWAFLGQQRRQEPGAR